MTRIKDAQSITVDDYIWMVDMIDEVEKLREDFAFARNAHKKAVDSIDSQRVLLDESYRKIGELEKVVSALTESAQSWRESSCNQREKANVAEAKVKELEKVVAELTNGTDRRLRGLSEDFRNVDSEFLTMHELLDTEFKVDEACRSFIIRWGDNAKFTFFGYSDGRYNWSMDAESDNEKTQVWGDGDTGLIKSEYFAKFVKERCRNGC